MEAEMKQALAEACKNVRLPRAQEIPDIGLYLEQTTKYINQCLEPLGCMEVTGSMIRNYVKMGLVKNPVQKQYDASQIQHLICISILKSAMSMEQIKIMFTRQAKVYSDAVAYDYFCTELENFLFYRFGVKSQLDAVGTTHSVEKTMLHSAIVAVSNIIYLNACFHWLAKKGAV